MVALSYWWGGYIPPQGISLMLGCDQGLLSCLSLVAIASPAPSVTVLFLGMPPAFEHMPKEQRSMWIHERGLRNSKNSTFEKLLLHLILHELNSRELGSAGLWRKGNMRATSLNALFYPLVSQGLKMSAYVSFLYLRALCDAIQWWHCFDAWKSPPGRRSKDTDSGICSSSLTLTKLTGQ